MQVFLDTNIVLEGRPLAHLPWAQLGAYGPLLVYFVPKVLSEIDGKKRDGRLGEKAGPSTAGSRPWPPPTPSF